MVAIAVHARRRARRSRPAHRPAPPPPRRPSREGPSFAAAGGWGTVRLPDVAYDAYHGVYLTVSGNNAVGRFVSMDGEPLGGQFVVSTVAARTTRAARVAYSPDLRRVPGGVVRHPRQPQPVPGVGAPRPLRRRRHAAVPDRRFLHRRSRRRRPTASWGWTSAYAYASKRFLVAYNQIGPPTADIVAQLVDTRRQPRRRSAGAVAGQPLAARAERRLRHPQRHLHGGVGRVLQPGRARRRARAHGVGLDRRARPGA